MEAIKIILGFIFLVAVLGFILGAYILSIIKINQEEDLSKPNNDFD